MAEDGLLNEEQAALVFRRAAEIEASGDDAGRSAAGFDAMTLERIGTEAGLSAFALRRALDELRRGDHDAGRWAAGGIGAAGLAAAAAGVAFGVPEALFAVPVATAGAAGAAVGTQTTYAKHLKRATDAVELVLDELEHPPRPR